MIKLFKMYEEIEEARAYFLEATTPFTYTAEDGTVLPYRLFVPDHYDETKKYPLVILLHGAGMRGNDNRFQLYHDQRENQMLFAYQHYENFIFAIPQCPEGIMWSSYMEAIWPVVPEVLPAHKDCPENRIAKAVYGLTMALADQYSVDRDRLYVAGTSMGGAGVYEMLYRYPDVYAAGLAGCAVTDPEDAAVLKNLPLYILHGDADPVISVEYSRRLVAALSETDAEFVYIECPGKGHDFADGDNGEAIFGDGMRWIFRHSRKK